MNEIFIVYTDLKGNVKESVICQILPVAASIKQVLSTPLSGLALIKTQK